MQIISPIVRIKIADRLFMSGDGLLRYASVSLGEDARSSTCRFEVYDPGLQIGAEFFEMSFSQGGIIVPPDLLEPPQQQQGTVSLQSVGSTSAEGDALARQIIAECQKQGVNDPGQIAYILATAQHESSMGKFLTEIDPPSYEGRSDLGNTQPGDGRRFIGRGYVQITGRLNYTKYSKLTGKDLVGNPELAASPEVALFTLVHGMRTGAFTGVKVGDYISGGNRNFVGARAVVNGSDRAGLIAGYAEEWLARLPSLSNGVATPTQQAAAQQPPIKDTAETKPVEESKKGTEIIVEMGFDPSQLTAYHFIHTATHTRGRQDNSTVFEGQTVRWLMTRRTKNTAYKDITLKQLAEKVAKSYGLELEMAGDGPKYAYLDQTGLTDYQLLLREARAIGYSVDDRGKTLRLKPWKPEFTGFVITADILENIEFSDRASRDMQPSAASKASQPETSTADAKVAIDMLTGKPVVQKQEDSTATGKAEGKQAAITGSPTKPVTGTPATESAATTAAGAILPESITGLPTQAIGAIDIGDGKAEAAEIKDESRRVKGYESRATLKTVPELLTLAPGSVIGLSRLIAPDVFAREWRVSSVTHTYQSGRLTTTLEFYSPQKAKAASSGQGTVSLPDNFSLETPPAGKILNPHSDGGVRGTPFDPSGSIRGRPHNGIDTSGDYNLRAGFDGVVSDAEGSCRVGDRSCGGGFGNLVFIDGSGPWQGYTLVYAHLASITVSKGQQVKAGQVIGRMGDTGASSGDHLHLELRKGGARIDPEPYISPCFTGTYGQGAGTPLKCKGG
jgi:phage protein D